MRVYDLMNGLRAAKTQLLLEEDSIEEGLCTKQTFRDLLGGARASRAIKLAAKARFKHAGAVIPSQAVYHNEGIRGMIERRVNQDEEQGTVITEVEREEVHGSAV